MASYLEAATERFEVVIFKTASQLDLASIRDHKICCSQKKRCILQQVLANLCTNNTKRSHTQLDSRKQVIAFQDRVMTINIKEAQHPLKREKQVIDKSSIMLKISTKSMHRVPV